MRKEVIIIGFVFVILFLSFVSSMDHPDYPTFANPEFDTSNNQLTINDKLIYQTAYYSVNAGPWQEISLQGTPYQNYPFLLDNAQAPLPSELSTSGIHFLIVFSCSLTPDNSAWDCHGNGGVPKWQLYAITNQGNVPYEGNVPENFKVGIIGDQGLTSNSRAVLQLMKDEGVDLILHQGDFDYANSPSSWDNQITQILGDDFPYFASVGNHDTSSLSGYEQVLNTRLSKIPDAQCTGPENGVKFACTYKGVFFVLSGIGTTGSGHETYLDSSLASSNAIWKFCSWHKNQRLMQVGGKSNEVGWEAYDICREYGALIVTGHEHSYSRTHAMSNFETQSIYSTSNTVRIDEGVTFAVVSGIAGYSIRVQNDNLASNPWWATVYTADQNANYGALICELNVDGNPRTGHCYLKTIDGYIADDFYLDNWVGI